MTTVTHPLHPAPEWASFFARIGHFLNGFVHLMMGAFVSTVALYPGAPLLEVFMVLIALGMLLFGGSRFVQAALEPKRASRRNMRRYIDRGGIVASGIASCALGLAALDLVLGDEAPLGGSGIEGWASDLLRWQLGPALIVGGGVAVVLFGLLEIYRAWVVDFTRSLKVTKMSARERRLAMRTGRTALFSRGMVLVVFGALIVQLGLHTRIVQQIHTGDTVRAIVREPSGGILAFLIVLGFMSYGVFQLVQARYRRIPRSTRARPMDTRRQ